MKTFAFGKVPLQVLCAGCNVPVIETRSHTCPWYEKLNIGGQLSFFQYSAVAISNRVVLFRKYGLGSEFAILSIATGERKGLL